MNVKSVRDLTPLEGTKYNARWPGRSSVRTTKRPLTGFTIIELLVVISIIGLLSSVVLASLQSARAKARDAQRIQAMNELRKALFLYYDANGEYPVPLSGAACTNPAVNSTDCTSFNGWYAPGAGTTLASLLAPYLPSMPVDPAQTLIQHNTYGLIYTNIAASARYGYGYRVKSDGSEYDLITRLESPGNPLRCGVMQYISKRGTDNIETNAGDEWCELESGGSVSNIDATQQLYALSNSY